MQSDRENTGVSATFYFTTTCLHTSRFSPKCLQKHFQSALIDVPKPLQNHLGIKKCIGSVLEGLPRGLSAPFRLPPGLPKSAHATFLGPPKPNLEAIELRLLFLKASEGLWDLILASLGTNFGLLF